MVQGLGFSLGLGFGFRTCCLPIRYSPLRFVVVTCVSKRILATFADLAKRRTAGSSFVALQRGALPLP